MYMYEAKQRKEKSSHIIPKYPKMPLKSITDCRGNNFLQLMKLKETPYNKILLRMPLLWDLNIINRFLEHYADEDILDISEIDELVKRFEEGGIIQEGLKDLKKDIPQYDGPEIPMIIHRFWSGGSMSDEVVTRLISERKRNSSVAMKLWHSTKLEEKMRIGEDDIIKREKQRQQLKDAGFQVSSIESLIKKEIILINLFSKKGINPMLSNDTWDKLTSKAAEKKENIAYLSDIARLIYLYACGGHHMDVDIGMGKMFQTRKQAYRHGSAEHPDIPLLGGLLRDKTTVLDDDTPVFKALEFVQNELGSIFSAGNISSDYFKLLLKQSEAGAATNSLIATHPKNKLIAKGLVRLLSNSENDLGPGMGAANDYLNDETKVDVIPYTIPEYLLELQHYTEESDNLFDSQ